ncbi:CobW family GTP-binding protein [Variovorax paradoxus]|jgi:G3E family GTPase|uniref:CobW family GTP-binding protein n=1 Tax=Variovorax paradoxus TaxID=34073 RepID=UPI0033995141
MSTPGALLPPPIELILLTGFLGSGKTTLLAAYLQQPQAANTAVIVNEVGEIDLDGAVLSSTAAKVPMALLSNGCVCCAIGSDLPGTIAMLIEDRAERGLPPLARIVLETSGLSRPGPVLRSLGPLAAHLRVCVVSTFDCERGDDTLALPEAAAQIAGAQRIVLTRQDVAGPAAVAAASELLARINPSAELVSITSLAARALAALEPLEPLAGVERLDGIGRIPQQEPDAESAEDLQAHTRIRTGLCRFDTPVDHDALAEWLDNLAGLCGERLLRVKGLVDVAGVPRPLLVQSVGTLFAPLLPLAARTPDRFLVVIVRDMALTALRSVRPPLPFVLTSTVRPSQPLGRPLRTVFAEACA